MFGSLSKKEDTMAITEKQQENREEPLGLRGGRMIHPGLKDIQVNTYNLNTWSKMMITEEEIDRLVVEYEQCAVIRLEEQQIHDNTKLQLSQQINLIAESLNDTNKPIADEDPKRELKNKSKWVFGILTTGIETYGKDTMLEAWKYYFEDNSEHKKMYEDLLDLILVRAESENERSRMHLITRVYENEGRIRSVCKTLNLCEYHCHKGIVGKINPGGGGYSEGCLANKYGFCKNQHVGEPDWDHTVSLAKRNKARLIFPEEQKTITTGPFVGAGAGGYQQNNRQEIRVWATTTVAQKSVAGKAPRDMSYNKTTQVVGGASSTTTTSSSGGAGNGNRMQQQTQKKQQGKGKSGFTTLREESSEEED